MTNKEAIKMLKSKMDGNTDTSYEWAETVRMAIKALEQEPVLDKIRAEIEKLEVIDSIYSYEGHDWAAGMKSDVLDIIDKYREKG